MSRQQRSDSKVTQELREDVIPSQSPAGTDGDPSEPQLTNYNTAYSNIWARWRYLVREPFAEFFGTMLLVLFGNAVNCQVVLSQSKGVASFPQGDYLSIAVGWGIGIALGVWVSGGISGGHINPAVTLAMAVFRRFPWRKVPIYMFSQLLGGIVGAAIAYATYFHAIDIVEGGRRTVPGTAGLFATYPAPYLTAASAFFDEFLGAALLVMAILAATDKKNLAPHPGLLPLVIGLTLIGIASSFGMQTGFAVNPARDLGPRILTAMVGYGREVFNFRNQYWIWCPIMAPFLGALSGALTYDAFMFVGEDSIINTPDPKTHAQIEQGARERLPQAADRMV